VAVARVVEGLEVVEDLGYRVVRELGLVMAGEPAAEE